jgi:hypothetical protein
VKLLLIVLGCMIVGASLGLLLGWLYDKRRPSTPWHVDSRPPPQVDVLHDRVEPDALYEPTQWVDYEPPKDPK